MVAETGLTDRVRLAEKIVEVDGIEERPPRIVGVLRKAVRVVLVGERNFVEVPLRRRPVLAP